MNWHSLFTSALTTNQVVRNTAWEVKNLATLARRARKKLAKGDPRLAQVMVRTFSDHIELVNNNFEVTQVEGWRERYLKWLYTTEEVFEYEGPVTAADRVFVAKHTRGEKQEWTRGLLAVRGGS